MGSKVCFALHFLFFSVDIFSLTYNSLFVGVGDDPKVYWMSWRSYGGKLKFLTYINKVLQTLFFAVALANDVFGSHYKPSDKSGKKSGLQSFLNTLYASLAFPVGTFVVITFWCIYTVDRELVYPTRLDGIIPPWMNHVMFVVVTFWCIYAVDRELVYPTRLDGIIPPWMNHVNMFVVMTFWCIYAVDRELVYPTRLDGIIPPWMNHVMHTTVLPLLLIEKYTTFHEYPSKKKGLTILLGFALLYLLWILWIAYYVDFWVYPILQVMEAHQRVIFITVLMAFFISIYILGEAMSNFIWRKEIAVLRQKVKSSQKGSSKQKNNTAKSAKSNDKQNGKAVNSPGKSGKRQKAKTS